MFAVGSFLQSAVRYCLPSYVRSESSSSSKSLSYLGSPPPLTSCSETSSSSRDTKYQTVSKIYYAFTTHSSRCSLSVFHCVGLSHNHWDHSESFNIHSVSQSKGNNSHLHLVLCIQHNHHTVCILVRKLYTRTGHLTLQLGAGLHDRQTTDGQNTNDMLLPVSLNTGPALVCVLSPLLLTSHEPSARSHNSHMVKSSDSTAVVGCISDHRAWLRTFCKKDTTFLPWL